jgi:CrcB protein
VVSLASVSFGAHLAKLISSTFPALPPPGRVFRYGITIVSVLTYVATFPAYFRLPADFRHQATAALLFSFPGTLTRYLLSIHLNPLIKTMPLGTFIANIIGNGSAWDFSCPPKHSDTSISERMCDTCRV